MLAIGLAVLHVVSRDLRGLARAARSVGEGQLDAPLSVHRREPLHAMVLLGETAPGDGAAIGLALYPDDGRDVDSLIQVADLDMYSRKPPA